MQTEPVSDDAKALLLFLLSEWAKTTTEPLTAYAVNGSPTVVLYVKLPMGEFTMTRQQVEEGSRMLLKDRQWVERRPEAFHARIVEQYAVLDAWAVRFLP